MLSIKQERNGIEIGDREKIVKQIAKTSDSQKVPCIKNWQNGGGYRVGETL